MTPKQYDTKLAQQAARAAQAARTPRHVWLTEAWNDIQEEMDAITELPLDIEWEGLDEALEDAELKKAQAQLRGVA